MGLNCGPVEVYSSGSGDPSGVVTAPIGKILADTVGGRLWFKTSGSGNTGWKQATLT